MDRLEQGRHRSLVDLETQFPLLRMYRTAPPEVQAKIDVVYMQFIASKGCMVSRKKPVHVHHHRALFTGAGMGKRPDDIFTVPLAPEYHNQGNNSVHALSVPVFEERFGVRFEDAIQLYHRAFIDTYLKG